MLEFDEIYQNIYVFDEYRDKIDVWSDLNLFKWNRNETSDWINNFLEFLFPIIQKFISSGYSRRIPEENNMNYLFLRNFVFYFLESREVLKSLFRANKWKGRLGLEFAIYKLKDFEHNYKRIPSSVDLGMSSIHAAVTRKIWMNFNIEKWNDLLQFVFGQIHKKGKIYEGKEGLEQAIEELKEFKRLNGRLPKQSDDSMSSIVSKFKRRYWKMYGFDTWNSLLEHVFGKTNTIINPYKGKAGLDLAICTLKKFQEENGRLPINSDEGMNSITRSIHLHEWDEFRIYSWNELLFLVFGENNQAGWKYYSNEGFEIAKTELKQFESRNNRLPTSYDEGMSTIMSVISQGQWKSQNIESWNDLLFKIFGKINRENFKYEGSEGLKRAIHEIKKIKIEFGKIPSSKSKGMSGIMGRIQKKGWESSGISSWNDLIFHIFGEVKRKSIKYVGRKGLDIAIEELKKFSQNHNRLPKAADNEMKIISSAISRGEWQKFRINSWNELLLHVFGKINMSQKKYVGQKGLEYAKSEIRSYIQKNKKYPKINDFNSIYRTARDGRWTKFGINSWNDLKKVIND